ncbi:hypothetical protein [Enhygromyxa salina]|uniref:Uncharacterized protein n=1 Tax=Enhygromyxa salina TaxID=215803 RepID=A0A2S9YX80_9BACT|nr:hypothetical protein [Enhygromyxa salina]PRQ09705.1 hypothetical protein ENSA7_04590 [Enhygromyxa salina]
MSNTYYISTPFYLQWHDQGPLGGQWNGSSTNSDYYELDAWSLPATSSETTFYFTAKQSSGHTGTSQPQVFATMVDRGGAQEITYGAKIDPTAPAQATALRFTPLGTELEFTAGRLISGDPKIKISETTTEPTCALIWTGSQWLYSYDVNAPLTAYRVFDCVSDPSAVITLSRGAHTIYVTDQTADGSAHVCAVFYADADAAPGTNVGLVQSETSLLRTTATPVPLAGPTDRDWQCTLELFFALTNYKSAVLRQQ